VKLFVTLLALFAICATADAKLTKYWVLKMSINSAVAQYTAYKSREACEREKRRLTVGFKQLARKHKGINMEVELKCLDRIPFGYKIPR
jgi:hypothetical protein